MMQLFIKFLFFVSILILLFAIYVAVTIILSLNQLKQEIAAENTPSDYNPLQILPPGVHPTPTVTTTISGQLTFTQNPLQGVALNSCLSNAQTINTDENTIITAAKQSVKTNTAIVLGGQIYYTKQILPSGKALANYTVLVADSISKEKRTISLLDTLQTDVKGFTCNGANPSAQQTLITKDTTDTVNALQQYNASVKNFITVLVSMPGQPKNSVSSVTKGGGGRISQ